MDQRRTAIDEDRLVGPYPAHRMRTGLALRRRMAVGRGRQLVRNIGLDLGRRQYMSAEIGDLPLVGGDVAPHSHL